VVTNVSEEASASIFSVEVSLKLQASCFSGSPVLTQQSLGYHKVVDHNIKDIFLKNLFQTIENIMLCEDIQKNCNFVVFCSMVPYCKPVGVHQYIGGMHWHILMRIVVYDIPSLAERVTFLRDTDLNTKGFVENDTYLM
jgi:hypothetical protein